MQMERDIAFLSKVTGDSRNSEHFLKASELRHKAIKFVFWNETKGQWLDYWLSDSKCHTVCKLHTLRFSDSSGSGGPDFYLCNSYRNIKHGKLLTKIRMYLLQTSSLCGSSHSTQVCHSKILNF